MNPHYQIGPFEFECTVSGTLQCLRMKGSGGSLSCLLQLAAMPAGHPEPLTPIEQGVPYEIGPIIARPVQDEEEMQAARAYWKSLGTDLPLEAPVWMIYTPSGTLSDTFLPLSLLQQIFRKFRETYREHPPVHLPQPGTPFPDYLPLEIQIRKEMDDLSGSRNQLAQMAKAIAWGKPVALAHQLQAQGLLTQDFADARLQHLERTGCFFLRDFTQVWLTETAFREQMASLPLQSWDALAMSALQADPASRYTLWNAWEAAGVLNPDRETDWQEGFREGGHHAALAYHEKITPWIRIFSTSWADESVRRLSPGHELSLGASPEIFAGDYLTPLMFADIDFLLYVLQTCTYVEGQPETQVHGVENWRALLSWGRPDGVRRMLTRIEILE